METKLISMSRCVMSMNRCRFRMKDILLGRCIHSSLTKNIPTTCLINGKVNITRLNNVSTEKLGKQQFHVSGVSRASVTDEDEDEDYRTQDKGRKILNVTVNSLRIDAMLKTGLGMSRNKIENAINEKRIQKNGEKLVKKSENVEIGDELDLIMNKNMPNPNLITVSRVTVLDIDLEDDRYSVRLQREKNLIVENNLK